MAPPLSLALPAAAAAATFAYLDGKYRISYDAGLIAGLFKGKFNLSSAAKNGRVNTFYSFETAALDPKVAGRQLLVYEDRQWTYRQGYDIVLKHATWLKETHGVKAGDVVAIDFMNCPTYIWLLFGLWALGAKAALINFNLTGDPLCHSIRTSTARLVLVDPEIKPAFDQAVMDRLAASDFRDGDGPVEVVFFSEALESDISARKGSRESDEVLSQAVGGDMALLIFTSGTTGLPKPATINWDKINLVTVFVTGLIKLQPTDRFFTVMPLYHSAANMLGLLTTMKGQATFVLGRKFSATNFWPAVCKSEATIIQYVGETCRYLLSAPPTEYDKAHKVREAFGNGLRPDIWEEFKERFGIDTICEFYGATEGPAGTYNRSRNPFWTGAIGRSGVLALAIAGRNSALIELDPATDEPIRDAQTGFCTMIPRGADRPGEYVVKLPDVQQERDDAFPGYFGNKKATTSKILYDGFEKGDAWFRSGDLLRQDKELRLFFHDRIGDTFRWKSENVSTNEVADQMGRHPAVAEANVYGVEVPGHDGRAGCAAIVLRDGRDVNDQVLASLAEHALQSLPRYAVPIFLRFTKTMQSTGTNKQQKHVLRAEGVDPDKTSAGGDQMFWLQGNTYRRFDKTGYNGLETRQVKL